jgi:hypothetical protein
LKKHITVNPSEQYSAPICIVKSKSAVPRYELNSRLSSVAFVFKIASSGQNLPNFSKRQATRNEKKIR